MKLKFWERFKGFFAIGGEARKKKTFWLGELSWSERCKRYDNINMKHPLAKAQILTIAGQLMSEGIYVEEANVTDPHKTRAEEAAEKCRQLNDDIGLEVLLYDTAATMAKYGSCFWEKTFSPTFDARIIPMQEAIEPFKYDPQGEITSWRQAILGQRETPTWTADEIIHYGWNITSKSWPYGTSLLVGLETEFEILEQLETDIKDFMHKSAFPKEVWQIGDKDFQPTDDQLDTIKSKVKNFDPGDSFVTSFTTDYRAGGTGDKTITNLNDILNFLKDQCIDGLMVPPISKQWSSTMASAKEMMPWARANLIQPMQRIISMKIRNELYRPYLEDLGYSVKVTPSLGWEPPDAHMDERAELYATLVGSGIIDSEVAAEELGYGDKIDEMRKRKLEKQIQSLPPEQRTEEMARLVEQMQRKDVSPDELLAVKRMLDKILGRLSQREREDSELKRKEKKLLDYLSHKFGIE